MLRLATSADAAVALKLLLPRTPATARVLLTSAYQTHSTSSRARAAQSPLPPNAVLQQAAARTRAGSLRVAVLGATAAAALSVGLEPETHTRAALEPPAHAHKWQLLDQIGAGAFGTVRLGRHADSGEVAAVKVVEPDTRNYPALEREIAALKLVKALGGHRSIIDLKDVFVDGRKERASAFAREMGGALGFLHRHGLVHKDVKPENILMSAKGPSAGFAPLAGFVKLADFGSAGPASTTTTPLDDIGTSAYLPPELLESGVCTAACDMWALGCVLYIVLSGAHPFDLEGTASDAEVEERVKRMPVTFDFAAWTHVSADAKDLISKLLHKDPSQRLTADQLLVHPWLAARVPQLQQQQTEAHVAALLAAAPNGVGQVCVSVAAH
ncbi:hypothetical protein PybrP1_009984 [[Pythium] brassicae (nom. inval.)]|nr:hypothetical protein PybrP1_009984 [[Pythium] brassicae (nom. inval.)]